MIMINILHSPNIMRLSSLEKYSTLGMKTL